LTDSGASVHSAPRDFLYTRLAQAKDPFGNIIGLAGFAPGTEAQTIKNQPSVTAMGVAYYRAQAAQDKRPEIKGPDVYASLFLSEEFRSQLIARPILRPMYGYFIARTAFIDLAFEEAIQNGTPQIVILGAGYDSRAYRFHDRLKETRVFELDTPATQNRKRTVLREQALPVPPRLSFVPVDLKTDDFIKKLENAGFNQKLRSLFISEGLLYYLTETDVDKLLTAIAMNCIPGSRLCFDYMTSKLLSVNPGEPIQFWLEKTKMESYLTARGLRILDHLDNKAMIRRYLTLQDGTIAEKPTSHFGLILAEVNR
jgi:methyltransferase (TIGR00027 family)